MKDSSDAEPIIDPELPIVDAHHHLWLLTEGYLAALEARDSITSRTLAPNFRRRPRYLFDEFLLDLNSGHNVRATVFIDAHAMYRASGPEEMKSVGEVEFVNGVAAMAESGLFGDIKVCAGIVGGIDLALGDAVEDVIDAHIRAGGGRYRGVRSAIVHDSDSKILGAGIGRPHLMMDKAFRKGFKKLKQFGLSFEAWLFEPQLPELLDLARAFPDIQIILNHVGAPIAVGQYDGQQKQRFPLWLDSIRELSQCPNVTAKLGGLGIPFNAFKSYLADPPFTSQQLATEWKPYIESCIEAFGAHRCMFESNFPVDSAAGSYAVLWNAFKRIAAGASQDEKTALFSGTAKRVYRLDV